MKRLITLISAAALLAGCADSGSSQAESSAPDSEAQTTTTATSQTRHIPLGGLRAAGAGNGAEK